MGLTDVEGPGIKIILKDPDSIDEEENQQTVSADELMLIVNYLKDAGAEAISINDQRVVNTTDIVRITDTYIKMNSERISPPFEIRAIGDGEYLKSTLIGIGYVDKIKSYGQNIQRTEENRITIKKYNGKMEIKYIEEMEK